MGVHWSASFTVSVCEREWQRMRGHVWKTVLRTVVAVQLQISHTSVVCVREHSDESKTLIDTDMSPLVRNINN